MKEFLEFLLSSLVDDPTQIRINEKFKENNTVVYELSVAPEDMGKVIGRRGRIARAIRVMAKTVASRTDNARIIVEIV